ncbi:hypothetical protein DB31_8100 [Hyalangium minutum]|uniref:Uncharacterized protein n=1 Tax=Hyalangium minutum TaxID=394096 RepID=A0A085WIV4_9BACT|nr:hypothetical protein DB31_8100 [Hyalangium minutum]
MGRAAFVGLATGMVLGGVWLLVLGLRGLFGKTDCGLLSPNECELLTAANAHIGKVQTLCGGALIALALALYVLLRPYLTPRAPDARP